jgi:hypothetical protein
LVIKAMLLSEAEQSYEKLRKSYWTTWSYNRTASIGMMLMTLAVRTSKTLLNLYQYSQRYNPQGSHLHTHSRENLKS